MFPQPHRRWMGQGPGTSVIVMVCVGMNAVEVVRARGS